MAAFKAGAAFLPLDPGYPKERLDFILDDAKASVLLTQEGVQSRLSLSAPRILVMEREEERLSHFGQEDPLGFSQPSDLAYVIYTSGTTGQPKGVRLEQGGLWNLVQAVGDSLGIAAGSKVLQFASPSFDASIWEIFPTLALGGTLIMAPPKMPSTLDPGTPLERLPECHRPWRSRHCRPATCFFTWPRIRCPPCAAWCRPGKPALRSLFSAGAPGAASSTPTGPRNPRSAAASTAATQSPRKRPRLGGRCRTYALMWWTKGGICRRPASLGSSGSAATGWPGTIWAGRI